MSLPVIVSSVSFSQAASKVKPAWSMEGNRDCRSIRGCSTQISTSAGNIPFILVINIYIYYYIFRDYLLGTFNHTILIEEFRRKMMRMTKSLIWKMTWFNLNKVYIISLRTWNCLELYRRWYYGLYIGR